MDDRLHRFGSLAAAVLLVLGGTLATGILPPTPRYQLLAGALIVAGFAIGYAGFIDIELPD